MPDTSAARGDRRFFTVLACLVASAGGTALATVKPYDLKGLSSRSKYVVTAEVVELRSYQAPFHQLGEVMFTDVTIRVEQVLKGKPETELLTIQVLGGQIGRASQYCPESARYARSEKVLVFLREYNGRLWNTGWYQGKYRRIGDGSVVEGRRGLPIAENTSVGEVGEHIRRYSIPAPSAGVESSTVPSTNPVGPSGAGAAVRREEGRR